MKLNTKLFLLLLASISTTINAADADPAENPFPFYDAVQNVDCDKDGRTAAHVLTSDRTKTAVELKELLLENHLLVNAQDKAGQAPLHHAARLGRPEMIRALLHEKALVTRPDDFGFTVLHKALESNDEETIMLILHNGGKRTINIPNQWGFTPLHQAAQFCSPEIVQFLLEAGANPKLKDDQWDNETPLDKAQGLEKHENVKVLQEWIDTHEPKKRARTHTEAAAAVPENDSENFSPESSPKKLRPEKHSPKGKVVQKL